MDLLKLITQYPKESIILFSMAITLVSTLITKWMTNQEHMRSLKERQKQIQKDLKNHKPGEKIFEELQSELMQISLTMMKSSFKPLLITFVPFLILFTWIRSTYIELLPGWFWYYLGASFVSSLIYRKLFKMA